LRAKLTPRTPKRSPRLLSITTPDKVETSMGTVGVKDGLPSQLTGDKVYDNWDFTHALMCS